MEPAMTTIKVLRPHSLAIADAKTRSSDVFRAYASKYGTRRYWNCDRAFLATVHACDERTGSSRA